MLDVIRTIAPEDAMQGVGDLASYLSVGEKIPRVISAALDISGGEPPARILDYGCGHGRVMRWLRAAFPDATITGADVLPGAVEFCASTFGAVPLLIDKPFAETDLGDGYDLIWLGSVYTHLGRAGWDDLTDLLQRHLAPHGTLCFSVAGRTVAEKYADGRISLRPQDAPGIQTMLDDYRTNGLGFLARTRTTETWGRSIVRSDAVLDFLAGRGLTSVLYAPNAYGAQQDVVCARSGPTSAARDGDQSEMPEAHSASA